MCQIEYNKQEIRFQTSWLAYVKRKQNDSNHCCIVSIEEQIRIMAFNRDVQVMKDEKREIVVFVRKND